MRGDDQTGRAGGSSDGNRLSGAQGGDPLPGELEPAAGIARFLQAHPPFDVLGRDVVVRVACATELESLAAGTTIFSEGEGPVGHLRVIRSGAVEIASDGRVLDLLGEGELFGQASMLSGFPAGFEARAAQDTVCYRIPAETAQDLLARPEGLAVCRALAARAADRAVRAGPRADAQPGR